MVEANALSRVRPPSGRAAFFLFLTVNFGSAFFNIITDCDETFNYWEPMHFLLYGFGLQTPIYALRSYLYILVHAIFGKVADFPIRVILGMNKLLVFYAVRAMLGLFAAFGETVFYTGVRARFGEAVGFYTFLFLAASPGVWISVTAFLPSSFAMVCVMLSFGFWFTMHYRQAFLAAAGGVILGWPFAGLVFVPLGIDSLRNGGFVRTLKWGLSAVVLFLVPSVVVDYYYYKRPVVAIWNIVFYNVIDTSNRGSELYGVEPWTYYFVNGFLNFNLLLPLALLSLPVLLLFRKWSTASHALSITQIFLYSAPFYIWFAFMSRMPHKEERFLYTVYPCICMLAAACLVAIGDVLRFFGGPQKKASGGALARFLKQACCLVFLALAVSRIVSLSVNYHSPLSIYSFLSESELKNGKFPPSSLVPGPVNICVGKEWYRFPSSFFLPTERHSIAFIKSHFKGLLPKPFERGANGTGVIPSEMNNENREEPSRYIDVAKCHYLVDLLLDGQAEPDLYHDTQNWTLVKESAFLDATRSRSLYRAFWIPMLSAQHITHARYYVVRNRSLLPDTSVRQ